MIAGMSGPLLSHDALDDLLRTPDSSVIAFAAARPPSHLRTWHARLREQLGPTAGARTVLDLVAEPLMRSLGFDVAVVHSRSEMASAILTVEGVRVAALLAVP